MWNYSVPFWAWLLLEKVSIISYVSVLLRDCLVHKFITSHPFIHQRTQTASTCWHLWHRLLWTGMKFYLQPPLSIHLDTNSEMGLLDLLLGPVKSQFFHKQPNTVNHMTKQNTKAMLRSTWVIRWAHHAHHFLGKPVQGHNTKLTLLT